VCWDYKNEVEQNNRRYCLIALPFNSKAILLKIKMDYFPHTVIRLGQKEMIESIEKALLNKESIVISAPTGIGKTAGAIAPSIKYLLEHKKKVFFLTSRQTQHLIALSTIKDISKKSSLNIKCADIVGRKSLCPQEGIENLYSNEFAEYCKASRKNKKCEYYNNTITDGKVKEELHEFVSELKKGEIQSSAQITQLCKTKRLCPYELSIELAKDANIIIGDYHYLFNPEIKKNFLQKISTQLKDIIVIVDEAHNLPIRIREVMSSKLTSISIRRAVLEAKSLGFKTTIPLINAIEEALNKLSIDMSLGDEILIPKDEFISLIEETASFKDVIETLSEVGDMIRIKARHSYIGSLADFLEHWLGPDEGYARILSRVLIKTGEITTLSYHCLDPSLVSKEIFSDVHCAILMSATLNPTQMYKKLLGLEDNTQTLSLESPFPKDNRLSIAITKATTKFTKRTEEEYQKISSIINSIFKNVKSNSLVFFPSYAILEKVRKIHSTITSQKILYESQNMSKAQKESLVEEFKSHSHNGALLFAVISGSFSEGIDLPGELLNCVIIVGIPFARPDLETKELIKYYDNHYGLGVFYGYIFPAMNKVIQAAGRCIRTEKDRGAIIFLDERFSWKQYNQFFPKDWNVITPPNYETILKDFFKNN
ncbi:MAG TPA: ATP-dependent DNA helicase, partial [Candidatus Woesearchaeota archaeon]|nr:ATP-dependent DNA helicase [Candidatus Woesearchaeota archaeon]